MNFYLFAGTKYGGVFLSTNYGTNWSKIDTGLTVLSTGNYKVAFDGSRLTSGVYFYRIAAISSDGKNSFNQTKKMILMK
jgi:hypothetical protein